MKVKEPPALTCDFCGNVLSGRQSRWCSKKHQRYGQYMADAETLWLILEEHPNGMTIEEIRDALIDAKAKAPGQAEFVISTLRELLPENVLVRQYGIYRFAQSFDEGKAYILRRLINVGKQADNLSRDMDNIIAHFPSDAHTNAHLDTAMDAARMTSKAINKALKLHV